MGMNIEPELAEKFERLVQEEGYDALEYWCQKINPKVVGMEDVKKAILLSMVSHNDRYGDRGRIHVLLKGDPGTAKSQLMRWGARKMGGEFCSHRTTEVGLTGDMSGDAIKPGVLPRADGGLVCIDELDKFKQKDLAGLLEAMSDGVVKLEGGGKSAEFKAEVRCICGCNSTDKFSPELMDRFDFKFELKNPSKQKEKEIMSDRVDSWFMSKDGYAGHELRKYIDWCHYFAPDIDSRARRLLKDVISIYIDLETESKGVRSKEAIIRVAYTIAKLHYRDVQPEDGVKAILMLDKGKEEPFRSMSERLNGELKDVIQNVVGKP